MSCHATRRKVLLGPLALVTATLLAWPAAAIDRIRIHATRIAAPPVFAAEQADIRFDLLSTSRSRLIVRAVRISLPQIIEAQTGKLTQFALRCENPVIREPLFACPGITVDANASQWPALHLTGNARFNSGSGTVEAAGEGLKLAGSTLRFTMRSVGNARHTTLELPAFAVPEMRKVLQQWIQLPTDLETSGTGDLALQLKEAPGSTQATATITIHNAGFQNASFTTIGEKLELELRGSADLTSTAVEFAVQLDGRKGQALTGPVLLDFDKNSLQFKAQGKYHGTTIEVSNFTSQQHNLAEVSGNALVKLQPFTVLAADISAKQLQFPAAYSSYLQLPLATTPFNQLVTSGSASAQLLVRNNVPVKVDVAVAQLSFSDAARNLSVTNVTSDLHWARDLTGPPQPSTLSWESSQGWGIIGAATRLDFLVDNSNFRLLKAARLPFFDGALLINSFAISDFGQENMSGVFDAVIEPISVAPIAKALGWPEFAGQLSGRIPGLTYQDKTLTLQGNIETNVFDGRVVASNLRIREVFGAYPRLFADVLARNLDLDLITRTFEFGSITGRLDVDLTSFETFNWSPVAFDLKMVTPKGDRSRHRISQRAVQNLSNIGGDGGGVTAALQSGALRFFDDFGYDRLGLSCQLRKDICLMTGVAKADRGFYIVKGRGLPSINIIGNNERVNWPQLMTQVADALQNPDGISVN
jgi:hypothetical protein